MSASESPKRKIPVADDWDDFLLNELESLASVQLVFALSGGIGNGR
jgi:hypothetical protein